jgi:hypothetical protein
MIPVYHHDRWISGSTGLRSAAKRGAKSGRGLSRGGAKSGSLIARLPQHPAGRGCGPRPARVPPGAVEMGRGGNGRGLIGCHCPT